MNAVKKFLDTWSVDNMTILHNIIRTIQWLPIIWKDADWDWEGLLYIIDYKVKRMRQLHLTKSSGAHWSLRVREMDELRHLIALYKSDPDDEWDNHYWQWCHNIDINDKCKNNKEHNKALQYSHRREEYNWHRIWSYLDENLRNWWD